MRWRWLPLILALSLVIAGCALRAQKPPVTERDIVEETTPEPTDPKTGKPQQPVDDGDLTKWLDDQAQPRIQERPLPPEPPEKPDPPLPPEPREPEPLPDEGPLERVDPEREHRALGGEGASSRRQAALSLTREGRTLLESGKPYLAEKRFERALSIDPQSGQAYLGLAELRFTEKKWAQAADLATKAALRLPKEPYFRSRAHVLAAKAMINDDRPRAAHLQVMLALEADAANREARILRVRLERFLGIVSPKEN